VYRARFWKENYKMDATLQTNSIQRVCCQARTIFSVILIEGQQTKYYPDAVQQNTLILYRTLLSVSVGTNHHQAILVTTI